MAPIGSYIKTFRAYPLVTVCRYDYTLRTANLRYPVLDFLKKPAN
jgi:hypothetical protein